MDTNRKVYILAIINIIKMNYFQPVHVERADSKSIRIAHIKTLSETSQSNLGYLHQDRGDNHVLLNGWGLFFRFRNEMGRSLDGTIDGSPVKGVNIFYTGQHFDVIEQLTRKRPEYIIDQDARLRGIEGLDGAGVYRFDALEDRTDGSVSNLERVGELLEQGKNASTPKGRAEAQKILSSFAQYNGARKLQGNHLLVVLDEDQLEQYGRIGFLSDGIVSKVRRADLFEMQGAIEAHKRQQ